MEVCTNVDELSWDPHPFADGVKIKPLVTKRDDDLNVSCLLVKVPVGIEIAEHTHEEQVDILYPLRGRAEMYVDQTGTFALKPGVVVRVPKGAKHRIFNVTDELIIYDVFHPATI
jgi:quercetin dioxygenase-like cupin family protein